jgi:protein-S-isoprenylcysteine O-methyltransferase Ste14
MKLPRSCGRGTDPILIALTVACTYSICCDLPITTTKLALILIAVVTVLMHAVELAQAHWHNTPRPTIPLSTTMTNASIRWFGTMTGLVLVLFAWWLFTEYRDPIYRPLFDSLPLLLAVIPVITAICIFYTEWRLGPAENPGWQYWSLLRGRTQNIDWRFVRDDLIGVAVKGFFFPINFVDLIYYLTAVRKVGFPGASATWPQIVNYAMAAFGLVMIAALIPGYMFGSRLFGTQIRKIDHSLFGWVVTLCCYPPLLGAVFYNWLNYAPVTQNGSPEPWVSAFSHIPALFYVVGGAIIITEIFHCWGEAAFNLRSSNLSNRGIITNGPYRFCKHPVYVAKCIGWFLVWLPFQNETALQYLRNVLLFLGVCGIYFMRGLAEEKLLSSDPNYVAYALWIDEHGIFARLGRAMPAMSFQWRLRAWKHQHETAPPS